MSGLKHGVLDTLRPWKNSHYGSNCQLLRYSISLGMRKLSRASIIFITLCFALLILISYPRTRVNLETQGHPQANQTSSVEQRPKNQTLEVEYQQSSTTPNPTPHPNSPSPTPSHIDVHVPENTASPDVVVHPGPEKNVDLIEEQGAIAQPERASELRRDRRLVLVIPATSPNPDLCKTIVTALALGYPSPIIINWGIDYHAVTKWEGGANLPKIPGFVKYLDAAMHPDAHPDERLEDDDLVLMVDAYDVWFQLPVEVLLKRYHAINKRANDRLRQQWGGNKEPMPMQQTIVAASGKNCHPQPDSGSNMHCERLPDSPLRADLYGPGTDKNATRHRDHRPKYINGGVYVGPAGDMRRLFRRASQKMEAGIGQGIHLFSEQGIPGEVLGEQEVWRQWRRAKDAAFDDDDAKNLMDRDFEYHFGLDYHQELSIQTFWTDTEDGLFDGAFVSLNNQTVIDQHSTALGISPVRLTGIPNDVVAARNPLTGVIESPDWGEMPLYADFFTESVPVIVHHNGFKERRTSWWDQPWFYQELRHLLALRMATTEQAAAPLAAVDAEGGVDVRYWAPPAEASDRRPRLMVDSARAPLANMEFQHVCQYPDEPVRGPGQHWWDEVFRDAEGPFK